MGGSCSVVRSGSGMVNSLMAVLDDDDDDAGKTLRSTWSENKRESPVCSALVESLDAVVTCSGRHWCSRSAEAGIASARR